MIIDFSTHLILHLLHLDLNDIVAVVRAGKLSVYIKTTGGDVLNRTQLKAVYDHSARSLTYYMMPK